MAAPPENAGKSGDDRRDDIYEARIVGSLEQLDKLLRSTELDVGCSHPHFQPIDDQTVALLAYADLRRVEQIRARGLTVELGANVSERAEALGDDIGQGDRFEGGRIAPRGFGVRDSQEGTNDAADEDPKRR
jgi:hypothetical protein